MNFTRAAQANWLKFIRRRTLSQRFLLTAVLVISLAMVGLGYWIGHFVQQAITRGVAETAASSVDSLLSHAISEFGILEQLDATEQEQLRRVFAVASEAQATPLFNIRLRNLSGETVYENDPDFVDDDDEAEDFNRAVAGVVQARLLSVALPGVGSLPSYPVDVLEIYSPVRSTSTGAVIGVAELYFSADAVNRLRDEAQLLVWLLVGLGGTLVIAVLYLVVDRATQTIARQRQRLANELSASRRLGRDNLALSREAQNLRRQATAANESLLAHVGSDIHDGPIQLLTLTILSLTKARRAGADGLAPSIEVVTKALDDLRDISKGLVLPELADATLAQTIDLAATRHKDLTGTRVQMTLQGVDVDVAPAVKITAYRVVQEALTNAFRHGGGQGQSVSAVLADGVIRLAVENEATTAPAEPRRDDGKLGLRGMRFRVESVGGRLEVNLGLPRTSVVATFPAGPGIDVALPPGS